MCEGGGGGGGGGGDNQLKLWGLGSTLKGICRGYRLTSVWKDVGREHVVFFGGYVTLSVHI